MDVGIKQILHEIILKCTQIYIHSKIYLQISEALHFIQTHQQQNKPSLHNGFLFLDFEFKYFDLSFHCFVFSNPNESEKENRNCTGNKSEQFTKTRLEN